MGICHCGRSPFRSWGKRKPKPHGYAQWFSLFWLRLLHGLAGKKSEAKAGCQFPVTELSPSTPAGGAIFGRGLHFRRSRLPFLGR
ncbi:MAG: hypothetical protein P8N49_00505, partial [Opitutales bacterium]|nr:hypothetical protein [Opitutales bacterium]